jgi:nucleoid-associated protein YgaU
VLVPTSSRARRWITSLTLPSLRALLVTTVLATSSSGAAFAGTGVVPPPPVSIALADLAVVAVPSDPAALYTVKSGDSFWSIAEIAITAHLGRPPSTAEVGSYWRRLMNANGNRLVHAGVPDLIFPGQTFVLPEP